MTRSRPESDVETEVERMLAIGREIRDHMPQRLDFDPDELYDSNGFPLRGGDFSLTDIEPALKD